MPQAGLLRTGRNPADRHQNVGPARHAMGMNLTESPAAGASADEINHAFWQARQHAVRFLRLAPQ